MTHMNSVDTDSPPGQDAISSWGVWMGTITLEPTGDTAGELWFTPDHGARKKFGSVALDTERDQYIVKWNRPARMTIDNYQIEVIDRQIHYAMTNHARSRVR